jgi:hypothetical protein
MCFEESIKHELPLHSLKQHKDLGPVNLPVDYPLQHYSITMHTFTMSRDERETGGSKVIDGPNSIAHEA